MKGSRLAGNRSCPKCVSDFMRITGRRSYGSSRRSRVNTVESVKEKIAALKEAHDEEELDQKVVLTQ